MSKKRSKGLKLGKVVLVMLMAIFLLPFVIMLLGSIKPNIALSLVPVDFSPFRNTTLNNYEEVFQTVSVGRAYLNSMYLLVFVVGCEVIIAVMAGYIFATKNFLFKRILFATVIVTMMMPRQLLMVPNFMVAKNLALIDSLTGTALTTINASYGIFLTRQYVLTIPKDFYESAKIDGCGEIKIFARIILPLIKPVMAAMAISSMFSVWNDYLWQNIMISSKANQTIPLMLAYLTNKSHNATPIIGTQLAASVIAVSPLLIFFLIFQKWFIDGISTGGIKE